MLISPALEFMLVRPDQFDPLHWALELPSLAAVRLAARALLAMHFVKSWPRSNATPLAIIWSPLPLVWNKAEGGERARCRNHRSSRRPRSAELCPNFDVALRQRVRAGAGQVLSAYDGAIETGDTSPGSVHCKCRPVLDRSVPVLTSAFVDYVRRELNFHTDISYRLLNGEISRSWDYGTSPSRQGYAGAMNDLQKARSLNPLLKVLVVHGYTD